MSPCLCVCRFFASVHFHGYNWCVCVFVCVFHFSLGDGDGLVGGWQSCDAGELPNEEQVVKC